MGSYLNEYFDNIYCINLARRADRWEQCLEEFSKLNIAVERIDAVDGNPGVNSTMMPGEIGCSLSHVAVLDDMIKHGYRSVLVLEDDVIFADNAIERLKHIRLPEVWDLLYFGGNHITKLIKMSGGIGRVTRTYTTSSYGIRLHFAKKAVEQVRLCKQQVDVVYASFQRAGAAYAIDPPIAWQRPGFSDVQHKDQDYTDSMKK